MGPTSRDPLVVLATHWLGDTFWALQIVPFLADCHPGAAIHLLVHPSLRWLAECWVPPDRVHAVRGLVRDRQREGRQSLQALWHEGRRLRRRLRRAQLLVDLTGTPAAALLTRLIGPRHSTGLATRRISALSHNSTRRLQDYRGHLAARPWWLLEPLLGGRSAWPTADGQLRPQLPGVNGGLSDTGPILLFPGAGWLQKRWPLERFVSLARLLDCDVQLLFAPDETSQAAQAALLVGETPRVRTIAGAELLRLLSEARAVVSNDSGAAHLAAAAGLPTLALFGPTNPAICGPRGPRVKILKAACPEGPRAHQEHCHDTPAYSCSQVCLDPLSVPQVHEALKGLLIQG